jgi:hypothetical protein
MIAPIVVLWWRVGINSDAFAVRTPFVRSHMMRHIEAGERACGPQVWMERKQSFSKVWGCLEIREKMVQEVVWIGPSRVTIVFLAGSGVDMMVRMVRASPVLLRLVALPVIENDYLVHAEDSGSSGDLSSEDGFEIVCQSTVG